MLSSLIVKGEQLMSVLKTFKKLVTCTHYWNTQNKKEENHINIFILCKIFLKWASVPFSS